MAYALRYVREIDHDEAFTLFIKLSALRRLLRIAAGKYFELRELDIKTAFLNGNMDVEIYSKQKRATKTLVF